MGNGQNRNRRGGARTRHGPHRGGANGDRRGATHVMPSALANADENAGVDLDGDAEIDDISALDTEGDSAMVHASAPVESAATSPQSAQPTTISEIHTQPPTNEVVAEPLAPVEPLEASEGERRTPRGRFERFYAPGQGARTEQAGGNSASTSGTGASGSRAPTREPWHVHTPVSAHTEDDEVETEAAPSEPREDVRGQVGGLIDALHDLFVQDRAFASQMGSSRCGICFFHYPLGELVYREAEGFYVCQSCARALGANRVSMVRRQQRQ